MNYIVYNKFGEILRTGVCPDDQLFLQAKNNEFVMPGIADDDYEYIENNQILKLPIKPAEYYVFDYCKKEWIDPRTPETQWPIVRQQRDTLLQQSDYTQLPDVPLNNKTAWAAYRQELRDITNQPDPFNIIWPTPPQR